MSTPKAVHIPPNSGIIILPLNWFTTEKLALSWAKEVEGVWKALYKPQTCRTRLHDYWYRSNKNKKYPSLPDGSTNIPTDTESACIYFHLGVEDTEGNKLLILRNLNKLHKIEVEYGLTPTKIDFMDAQTKAHGGGLGIGVVFTGDKDWQSNLWKISLYSFLLKAVCCSRFLSSGREDIKEYSKLFRKHKQALLSKVKTVFEEHIRAEEFLYVHIYSGFVSICDGDNPKMAELLLGEKNEG